MLYRLLHLLLVLALLTAGQAWAVDRHAAPAAPGDEAQLQADSPAGEHQGADPFCHFCHCGAAHLTALPGRPPALAARHRHLPTAHVPWAVITHPGERSGKPPRA